MNAHKRLCRREWPELLKLGCYYLFAGWSSLVARWAHNPKVGGSNPPPATNLSGNVLFGKLARYLQEIELLRKPNTLREAVRICYAALPYINEANPREGVLSYLVDRKTKGIEPRTLENERIRVLAFCKHAGLKVEPKIPKFRYVVSKPEIYTPGELDALFTEAQPRDYWLFKTLLQAGLRMQEAMNLTFDCLTDSGILVQPHGDWTPKDHEVRTIKVPRSLIFSLRQLKPIENSPLVFPTQAGTMNWHILRALKRTASRAGVPEEKAWLHKFRANFCTTLLRAGMALPDVMAQMGHSNVKSTMRYMALLEGEDMQCKVEAIWQ